MIPSICCPKCQSLNLVCVDAEIIEQAKELGEWDEAEFDGG